MVVCVGRDGQVVCNDSVGNRVEVFMGIYPLARLLIVFALIDEGSFCCGGRYVGSTGATGAWCSPRIYQLQRL